jgi:methylphosphotriester-DNA--protein-cysteine methyltransferase
LPVLRGSRFWLSGLSWEIPTFDNAEDLVARLAHAGIIMRERSVDAAAERRFLRTIGMTLSEFQQISRARHAAALLTGGRSILDATYEAGYFDQAHLTRSLKQLVGVTPGRLLRDQPQLSMRSKT